MIEIEVLKNWSMFTSVGNKGWKYFCHYCKKEMIEDKIKHMKPCHSCGRAPLLCDAGTSIWPFPMQGPKRNKVIIKEAENNE